MNSRPPIHIAHESEVRLLTRDGTGTDDAFPGCCCGSARLLRAGWHWAVETGHGIPEFLLAPVLLTKETVSQLSPPKTFLNVVSSYPSESMSREVLTSPHSPSGCAADQ